MQPWLKHTTLSESGTQAFHQSIPFLYPVPVIGTFKQSGLAKFSWSRCQSMNADAGNFRGQLNLFQSGQCRLDQVPNG